MVRGDAGPITEQIKGRGAWGNVCVRARGRVCARIYAQTELYTVCHSNRYDYDQDLG